MESPAPTRRYDADEPVDPAPVDICRECLCECAACENFMFWRVERALDRWLFQRRVGG